MRSTPASWPACTGSWPAWCWPPPAAHPARRARPPGRTVDLRRTLRGSLRTGGDPIRLARRRRRVVRRRLVLLCDISGSMEPYARAYLQFLTCAARAADPAQPLGGVRVRHAPDAADARARIRAAPSGRSSAPPPPRRTGRAAPASATRCKTFNDRHGRRGHGPRRSDRDPVRRLGARRPGARGARDGAAVASGLPHRVGQPARRRGRLRAPRGRDGSGAALLRRAGQRPQPGGDGRGRRRHRRPAVRWRQQPAELVRAGARGGSVGRAPRRSRAARWRCRRATGPAAVARRRDGARLGSAESGSRRRCIYPGCERPAVPPHPLGGPQPGFCDLEEHNALPPIRSASDWRASNMQRRE